jgi:3-hydroxyisobutyrate dehydrogenase-like beta-hydroxyacid dehydrogenase
MLSTNPRIGFVGFGEVAFHMSCGLKQAGVQDISAYTRDLTSHEKGGKLRRYAEIAGVELVPTLDELVARSELVISAVTAKAALEIATQTAQLIQPGVMFADLNNVIPAIKKQEAELINARGASFVDIALIEIPALVEHRALMYVSGDGAEEFGNVMNCFGMNIEVMPGEAGQAATVKALMNIYLKGMQALSIEVALSAYKASIPIDYLSLLVSKIVKNVPDEDEVAFWIGRGVLHAHRKTAEVKDLMKLMKTWGIDPLMMNATAQRLGVIAQYGLEEYIGENLHPEDSQSIFEVMDQLGVEKGIRLR